MEPQRFDEWTKRLGSGASRRAFITGVLRAGAAALGLSAISARTARADDDDDDDEDGASQPSAARCQRKAARCQERNSFRKCAKCVEELAASGCPVPAPMFFCACASDRYCDDGNACTLDICSSNVCYNDPIEDTCVHCRSNRQCPNGGKCCKGRCCPAGTFCQVNAKGIGICCETCTNGETCCQDIDPRDGNPNDSRQYVVALATCVGQKGAEADLPTFCCGGCPGGYDDPTDPQSGAGCFCPARGLP